VREQQRQDTSVNITRGTRILKGRLPAVEDSKDPVQEWKAATERMKMCMTQGTFAPFLQALETALVAHGSTVAGFTAEASAMLRRRRLFGADGAAVRDASAGDAASAPFLALMQKVADHMVTVSKLTLPDVANFEMYLFFTSCLLGTATLRDQAYRRNLIDAVYMDENGIICESIFAPLHLKVKAASSESGHLLVADCKPRGATLGWLMLVCVVRPMRSLLGTAAPSKLIWGMAGNNNLPVSTGSWGTRIKSISKAHLGSPRTGTWIVPCLSSCTRTTIKLLTRANACCRSWRVPPYEHYCEDLRRAASVWRYHRARRTVPAAKPCAQVQHIIGHNAGEWWCL
jgi:hypothetical protein